LDISRNYYSDLGFAAFAQILAYNMGLKSLDISKMKELSDDSSLIDLAHSIARNRCLETLDLTGIRMRKPYLKNHLGPALNRNIVLCEIIGKY